MGVANHRRDVSLKTIARREADNPARTAAIFIHSGARPVRVGS